MSNEYTAGSIGEALVYVTHTLADEVLAAVSGINAQAFVDAKGLARMQLMNDVSTDLLPMNMRAGIAVKIVAWLAEVGVLPTEAAPNAPQVVEVTANVSAQGSTTQAAEPNKYAHLLGQGSTGLGIDLSGLAPRINRPFVLMAGDAVSAAVMIGTGLLNVFDDSFWAQTGIEDFNLREKISDWSQKVNLGLYGTETETQALLNGVTDLFGDRFDQMINTAAQLSSQVAAMQMVGQGARVDVGADAAAYARLASTLPLFGEELSDRMIRSKMPEQARRRITMIADLMAILKNDSLRQYAGVVGARTADEAVVKILQKYYPNQSVGNQFRLALAYERLVKGLADCPSDPATDTDYLKVMGKLATDLSAAFSMVSARGQEVQGTVRPFRTDAQPVAVGSTSTSGWSISFGINLKFQWGSKA